MQNLYTTTVPVLTNFLGGLKNILTTAEAHAKENGMNEADMLNDAIFADMFPLKRQVQIATDNAKGIVARLTGKENPVMEDVEETFAELYQRIDKTLEFVQSANEADFEGANDREITMRYMPGKYMTGQDYAIQYAMPNFFFHVVTAYDIIRKNGVVIGKSDFMNNPPLKDLEA